MHNDDPVALVGGVRTAIGRFGGALKDVEAADLGAACIREVIARVGIEAGEVDEVVMGQVAQVGPDAYNARRCALAAGLPPSSTAMNVNRLCSSGLQAIVSGAQSILSGQARVVVAGGDESMSRQPFLEYGARAGWRLGSRESIDGTLSLLTDPFGGYQMGVTAEKVAERHDVSREQQDAFALLSQQRAAEAIEQGRFADQIVPVEAPRAKEPFAVDEHPRATHARATRRAAAGLPGRRHRDRGQLVRHQRRRRGRDADAALAGARARVSRRACCCARGRSRASSPRSWATRRRSRSRRRSSWPARRSTTSTSSS